MAQRQSKILQCTLNQPEASTPIASVSLTQSKYDKRTLANASKASSILAILIDCFLVSHTCLYSFILLGVQSVKMNIFLADLYSIEHEYIFGGTNHHLDVVAASVFVYFE